MNNWWENSKAFQWQYRLVESKQTRMKFVLPRWSFFVIASLCISVGVVFLFFPKCFALQLQFIIPIAGCLGSFLGLCLLYFVLTHSGQVVIDGLGRFVVVKFRSPKEQIDRHIPFSDFVSIETRQVKDMHGLHNHWMIELVGRGNLRIKIGAGFNGTFRKKSMQRIVENISGMINVPVINIV